MLPPRERRSGHPSEGGIECQVFHSFAVTPEVPRKRSHSKTTVIQPRSPGSTENFPPRKRRRAGPRIPESQYAECEIADAPAPSPPAGLLVLLAQKEFSEIQERWHSDIRSRKRALRC